MTNSITLREKTILNFLGYWFNTIEKPPGVMYRNWIKAPLEQNLSYEEMEDHFVYLHKFINLLDQSINDFVIEYYSTKPDRLSDIPTLFKNINTYQYTIYAFVSENYSRSMVISHGKVKITIKMDCITLVKENAIGGKGVKYFPNKGSAYYKITYAISDRNIQRNKLIEVISRVAKRLNQNNALNNVMIKNEVIEIIDNDANENNQNNNK